MRDLAKRLRQFVFRLIGLAILALILVRIDLKATISALAGLHWGYLLLAIAANVPMFGLKAWRWQEMLRMQGISYQWRDAFLVFMSGLFLGWFGTSGIITKLGLKLYPRKKLRDVETFVTDVPEVVPDAVFRLTHSEMIEDINIWFQPYPLMFKGNHHMDIYITGDTEEELEFKRRMMWRAVQDHIDSGNGGFMWLTPDVKPTFLEMPQKSIARFADVRKGGGFQYAGPIIPVDTYPACVKKTEELGVKHRLGYSVMARIIGRGHCMMFGFAFTFNRADDDEMQRVTRALDEAAEFALENGGLMWKPTIDEQHAALARMDPTTVRLFQRMRALLDPNGVMNPGNWEVS